MISFIDIRIQLSENPAPQTKHILKVPPVAGIVAQIGGDFVTPQNKKSPGKRGCLGINGRCHSKTCAAALAAD
ncbi:hypothetical protein [Janthinobacterium sp. 17J80-10]|uniref:hypothetical protein n=1 Tax=Janthinobacterium sp. 17J80-10 TaxID=2497863 RepID=UPI001005A77A|nr:hypothetical protein [Janthinobacterium sp. 17J80-10]QAU32840.1 hypothetical protein EKL02_00880 [Janthinobacterium sp. 17J80-10]